MPLFCGSKSYLVNKGGGKRRYVWKEARRAVALAVLMAAMLGLAACGNQGGARVRQDDGQELSPRLLDAETLGEVESLSVTFDYVKGP